MMNGKIVQDDSVKWYRNDQLHREDGPAVEWANGARWWFIHGREHREDGPAVEWADGTRMWYINGKNYSFVNWLKQLDITEEQRTLLMLKCS